MKRRRTVQLVNLKGGKTLMSYQLAETALDNFDSDWRAPWVGPNRVFVVADLAADTSQFVGLGTDGAISFRVTGDKARYLQAFRDLMVADQARELTPSPGYGLLNVIISPPTLPESQVVQMAFDDFYGLSQAA